MNLAITHGYVVPVAGDPIDDGTVLIRDGKIVEVGRDVEVPPDCTVVDAEGGWVLPGFVEAHGHLGVYEEAEGWAGRDTNETTDPNGARLRALDAINPAELGFADALSGGVTTAVIKPGSANPIGGQTVAIKTWGRTVDEMLIREPVSVKSALGENPKRVYGDQKKLPSTRQGVAAVIREAFMKAQDYRARRAAAREEGKPFDRDATLEVLVRVLDGELPWCQHTHRVDDIATALRLADEFGYRLVINHGTEGICWPTCWPSAASRSSSARCSPAGRRWSCGSARCATPASWPGPGSRWRSPPTIPWCPSTSWSTRPRSRSRKGWTRRRRCARSPSTRPASWASTTGWARCGRGSTVTWSSGRVIRST